MTGWIIALSVVAVLVVAGVVCCSPWSPVYKAINAACSGQNPAAAEKLPGSSSQG